MIRFNKDELFFEKLEISRYIGSGNTINVDFEIFEYEKPLVLEKSNYSNIILKSINYIKPEFGISLIEEINDSNYADIILTRPVNTISILFQDISFIKDSDKISVFLYVIRPQEFKDKKPINDQDKVFLTEFTKDDIINNGNFVVVNLVKYFKKDELFVDKTHFFIDVELKDAAGSVTHLTPFNKDLNIYGHYFIYIEAPQKPILKDLPDNKKITIKGETPFNVMVRENIDGFCYKIKKGETENIYKIAKFSKLTHDINYKTSSLDNNYAYVYYQVFPNLFLHQNFIVRIGVYKETETYLNKKLILYVFGEEIEILVDRNIDYKPQEILTLLGDYEYQEPGVLISKENINFITRYVIGKIITTHGISYSSRNADRIEVFLLRQNNEVIDFKTGAGVVYNNIGRCNFLFDKAKFDETYKVRVKIQINLDNNTFKPLDIIINKDDLLTNNNIIYSTQNLLVEFLMSNNLDTYENNKDLIPYI